MLQVPRSSRYVQVEEQGMVPPLWLQTHVPDMKHLLQYYAPQCRKNLLDWRCPVSKIYKKTIVYMQGGGGSYYIF